MALVLLLTGPVTPRSVFIAGREVAFTPSYDGPTPRLMAEVEDEAVLELVRRMPATYRVTSGSRPKQPEAVAPVTAGPPLDGVAQAMADAASPVMQLRAMALRRGWTEADLDGTGRGGDPSPAGGRGPVGLGLAELTLCEPPSPWDRKTAPFPWLVPSWKPPGLHWKPPAELTPKDEAVVEPEALVAEEEAPLAPEAPPAKASPGMARKDAEAELAAYPGDVAAALELYARISTTGFPSDSKLRYHFDKADLPRPTAAQARALAALTAP